ncbi:phage antirepressor N-terminal domain-containing protein [Bifidobacterium scardovii]|uniref:Antirepressor N-terminal domain protein n=1 Tax=Bifidobacterium scardovii TaxID=158787 RepID=A0A087DGR8_9BIFI|nr:phage antirepressor N-terminal domain-containing protein [Bifidobacterium scardovii]KFI94718.1 antirepressor N-terminal domain protein [Bifidobacterium scardovii]MDK6349852.1 phage antirepressor N-terminal domain-containing protein [Bifidobacterium scardovii]MDU8982556.1 phage antirepressor N-terminal domain-containing protein [Bifidobacterium scardovii]BAQ32060.1 putative phage antirepressor protein [Bifidobacterium scardovii JCM 12489 = DSM 13734]
MSDSLVQVPFREDTIDAIKANNGNWFVSLRRMCENLGVDYASQYTKLKAYKWAVIVLNTMTGSDGKAYQMAMIDRRTMTMWLANITPSRVKPELREKIEAYQCEAADALDEYFNEGAAIRVGSDDTEDDIIAKGMLAAAVARRSGVAGTTVLACSASRTVAPSRGRIRFPLVAARRRMRKASTPSTSAILLMSLVLNGFSPRMRL